MEEEEEETLRKSATEEEDIFGSSFVAVYVRFSTLRRSSKMLEKCLKNAKEWKIRAVRKESRLRTRESKKALRAGTNDTSIELF